MKRLLIIISVFFFATSCKIAEKETYLISDNYIGNIVIFGGVKSGEPKIYGKDAERIYLIPKTGILITLFKPTYGIINKSFFYLSRNKRTKINGIPLQDDWKNLDIGKVYAFFGNDSQIVFPKNKDSVYVEVVAICKPRDFEKISNEPFLKEISEASFSPLKINYKALLELRDSSKLNK